MEYEKLSLSISEIFKSRGNDKGLEWVKAARLATMKFLEGNPLKSKDSPISCQAGLPVRFGPKIRKSIMNGSTGDIRLVLTILNASRALTLGTEPNFSTITEPFVKGAAYQQLLLDMEKYTSDFWRANGYQWRRGESLLPRKLR
jgi:hypothetical protein